MDPIDQTHEAVAALLDGLRQRYTRGRRQLVQLLLDADRPVTVQELARTRPAQSVSSLTATSRCSNGALIGDGMGHVAFAGVGLAFLWGFEPLLGAASFAAVAASVLFRLQRSELGCDLALALIFYGGIALGLLLLARSGMGINRVLGLPLGSHLNLTWQQSGTIVELSLVVLAIVLAIVLLVAIGSYLVTLAIPEVRGRADVETARPST